MYCSYCSKLVSEKLAIRRNFCPYCGRRLHWFGIPEVVLSKPILQAILKRKNFLVKQKLQHIEEFYYKEQGVELPLLGMQDALAINPNNIKARFQLALYYIERKRTDKARIELKEILRLEPKDLDAFFYLANIAVEEEDYNQAIKMCDEILAIDHDNVNALYNKAVGYYYLGDFENALSSFRKIIVKEPENQDVLNAIKEITAIMN